MGGGRSKQRNEGGDERWTRPDFAQGLIDTNKS